MLSACFRNSFSLLQNIVFLLVMFIVWRFRASKSRVCIFFKKTLLEFKGLPHKGLAYDIDV